jgi:uncharacterized membrane protein YoaK (UPF0700 family)
VAHDPETSPSADAGRSRLALELACIGGIVDAIGYLTLAREFVANMSGNSVKLGIALQGGDWLQVARRAVPVAVFVMSGFAGVLLAEVMSIRGRRLGLELVLIVEASLLATAAAYGSTVPAHMIDGGSGPAFFALVVMLVAAMGLQASSLQRASGGTVRTTYVTGMLTNLATTTAHRVAARLFPRADADADGRRAWLLAGIWSSYLAGAVVGAAGERVLRLAWLGLPVAALTTTVIVRVARGLQNNDSSTHGQRRHAMTRRSLDITDAGERRNEGGPAAAPREPRSPIPADEPAAPTPAHPRSPIPPGPPVRPTPREPRSPIPPQPNRP